MLHELNISPTRLEEGKRFYPQKPGLTSEVLPSVKRERSRHAQGAGHVRPMPSEYQAH